MSDAISNECEIGKNIDKELIDKYNFTEYQNFLCLSRNFDFDIIINRTHSIYIDVVVSTKAENEAAQKIQNNFRAHQSRKKLDDIKKLGEYDAIIGFPNYKNSYHAY